MYETQLTVGGGNDCPNGMRLRTLTDKLQTDWSDTDLYTDWKGVAADIVAGPGEERSGGIISVWSTDDPTAQEVTDLKTWCGSHTPDEGMDATYTNLPRAEYVATGTTACGVDGGDSIPVMAVDEVWVPLAGGLDIQSASTSSSTGELSSGTYAVITSMTKTPGAGTYLVAFSGGLSWQGTVGASVVTIAVHNDGVIESTSAITFTVDGDIAENGSACVAEGVVVAAGKAVDIRYKVSGDGFLFKARTMTLIKQG